jgi:hypothetical protein
MIDLSTVPTDAPAGTYMAIIGDLSRRSDAYAAQLREQILARDDQIAGLRRDLAVARNDRLDARVRGCGVSEFGALPAEVGEGANHDDDT